MKFPSTNLDYIELYAKKLKEDNSLFEQQKIFIESQMESSSSLFSNAFKKNFKKKARDSLKNVGLIIQT